MKKPRIRYHLKLKKNEDGQRVKEELILAEINAGFKKRIDNKLKYDRFKISLETTIKPMNFGKPENKYKYDETVFEKFSKSNRGVKTKMEAFKNAVDALYSNYIITNVRPTAEQFKKDLLFKLGEEVKIEIETTTTLYAYVSEKIAEFEGLIGSGRKTEIDENSIKIYRTLLAYLVQYEYVTKTKLTLEEFDDKKYWNFWSVLDDIVKGVIEIPVSISKKKRQIKPTGFLKSSVRKYQKSLIQIFKLAANDKYKIKLNFSDTNLILENRPASKDLYVNQLDLIKIHKYMPNTEEMQLAKDYVILACMTGMRYESMEIAHFEEIHKNNNFMYIHSKQNKTGTDCYIPLMKPAREILKRNKNKFPKFPPNPIINKQIKELFKLAGVDSTTERTLDTYKSGTIKDIKKVSDMITTHDFRKSFVTNLHNNNIEETIITDITHPNRKPKHAMTAVYNKSTLMDKAIKFYNEVNRVNKVSQNELYRF